MVEPVLHAGVAFSQQRLHHRKVCHVAAAEQQRARGLQPVGQFRFQRGVLRTMLPIWLASSELAPLIAGWDVSHQSHGGAGAYYVRLKRLERAR
jgi:hypothetical protein